MYESSSSEAEKSDSGQNKNNTYSELVEQANRGLAGEHDTDLQNSDDLEEDDMNAHVEVESILAHRKRKNRFEYLVKWKDLPETENSWEPEHHFDTIQCIEDYWSNLNKTPKINLASAKFNSIFKTITILMSLSSITSSNAILVRDQFKFCEIHDNKAIWDIPESCKIENVPLKK